jgi:hypothetical protein
MAMNPQYGAPPMGAMPPPQNFGAPPLPGASVAYEFSEFENQTIVKVGGRAKTCGTISLVFGILGVLAGIVMIVVMIIGAASEGALAAAPVIVVSAILPVSIVNLVVGISLRGAGTSLVEVTRTQGNDIQHMMASISRFKTAFQLEALMSIGAFVLGIVLGIVLRSAS